jgi:hypothetical protein
MSHTNTERVTYRVDIELLEDEDVQRLDDFLNQ